MKKNLQNETDILGLFTKIQEQLAALERKMDSLMSRSLPQPHAVPPAPKPSFPAPVNTHNPGNARPNDHRNGRPMFRSTCADCKKECELPFKPSGDRPVYCKECFSRRKSSNNLKVNPPKEAPPLPDVIHAGMNIPESPIKEKKKSAAAKKPAGKAKPIAKKKKK